MMTEERAAPADDEELAGDASTEEPSQESPEAAAAKREKDLRDRLAQTGREAADAKRRADAAQAELAQTKTRLGTLETELQRVGATLTKQEESRVEAYLASLPPERQTAERMKLLEQRVARAETRTNAPSPAPVARQETDEQYAQRRVNEQVAALKREYGVDVDVRSPDVVWDSEAEFMASTKILAKRLAAKGQETPVAPKNTPPANPKAAEARELGSGRPTSPRAAGGSKTPPTTEDFGRVLTKYDSHAGPKATIAKLKEMRSQAEQAAAR